MTTEKILTNSRIWTADPGRPWAEALAIRGDRILAVGREADVRGRVGPNPEILDLRGGLVLPGFIDSHTHFLEGGFSLLNLQLRDARSREEFAERVAAKARSLDKGRWITNGDWDETLFTPVELPRREWIDPATPDNPVFINRFDGHMGLANSLALRLAGITRETPCPEGGEIPMDEGTGEPTGILKDAAIALVTGRIPERSFPEKLEAAEAALGQAVRFGLTSVTDMADASAFEVYQELLRRGRLTCRLSVYIPIDDVELLSRLRIKTPFGPDLLKLAGLKGFVDGSLGSRTALFFEPYADDPAATGILSRQMVPEGIMERRLAEADRAGLQAAIHAIGDKANSLLLDIFERVFKEGGPRDRRWRIEHAQHLRPSDIARFGRLGVIASVQPSHAADDGRWAERRIGAERCRTTYAFRSLSEAGATLALGSDWTVGPLDPLTGIFAAVTRRTIDGRNPGGWHPEQAISLEDAVRGYTLNGAYAGFADKERGSIEPGKLADLVVLDRDIMTLGPDSLPEARCSMTIVGGRIVFAADGMRPPPGEDAREMLGVEGRS